MKETLTPDGVPDGFRDITIKGYIVGPVVETELEKALRQTIPQEVKPLAITRMESEPPAAGMSEIAAVIEVVNNSREMILWCIALWHTKARKSAWRSLQELLTNSNMSKASGRKYIPLCISVGDFKGHGVVRFYFHGHPTPDQLDDQWNQMRKMLAEMPEQHFKSPPGPPEYGYFWDYESERWTGQLFGSIGSEEDSSETWIPKDVFGDLPKRNEDNA